MSASIILAGAWVPEGGWGEALMQELGIEPWRIPVVIVSAVCIYLVFLLLTRLFGQRILTATTSLEAVVVVMFGAVAGRVIIGHPPTLAAGAIGLCALVVMELLFGRLRSYARQRSDHGLFRVDPVLVVAHGKALPELQKKARVSDEDIAVFLRRSGLTRLSQVRYMILEANGNLSIIRADQEYDPGILVGVVGAERYGECPR